MNHKKLYACLITAGMVLPGVLRADGDCNECTTRFGKLKRGWCLDNCANIPKGAQPAPAGTYLNKFIETQAGLAEQDDFVLYKHMWYRGGTDLGPLGRYQLDLIAKRLAKVPFPVVIATSKSDALDETRRQVVISMLAARGINDPTRVIVAYPIAEGLYGEEAFRIYNGILFGGYGYGNYNAGGGAGGGAGGYGNFNGAFGGFRPY
jgi:hypothetical protein